MHLKDMQIDKRLLYNKKTKDSNASKHVPLPTQNINQHSISIISTLPALQIESDFFRRIVAGVRLPALHSTLNTSHWHTWHFTLSRLSTLQTLHSTLDHVAGIPIKGDFFKLQNCILVAGVGLRGTQA